MRLLNWCLGQKISSIFLDFCNFGLSNFNFHITVPDLWILISLIVKEKNACAIVNLYLLKPHLTPATVVIANTFTVGVLESWASQKEADMHVHWGNDSFISFYYTWLSLLLFEMNKIRWRMEIRAYYNQFIRKRTKACYYIKVKQISGHTSESV